MLSKNQIKYISSLKQKKFRKIHNEFIAEGPKIVNELIENNFPVKSIYALRSYLENNERLLKTSGIHLNEINNKELERISTLTTPNGVLAVINIPEFHKSDIDFSKDICLVLENIQDPGNMGAIIRTADWFGVNTIICSEDTVDVYNPKVIQATMGSFARIKVIYHDLEKFLLAVPGNIPVYGASLHGMNIYKTDLTTNGLIITGNESKGISQRIQKYIKQNIKIPDYSLNDKKAESLNASIATALILAEFRRRFSK